MKSVRDGERMIAKSEQELARMKPETTLIKVGDICVSTGKGSRIPGIKCKVLEVDRNLVKDCAIVEMKNENDR